MNILFAVLVSFITFIIIFLIIWLILAKVAIKYRLMCLVLAFVVSFVMVFQTYGPRVGLPQTKIPSVSETTKEVIKSDSEFITKDDRWKKFNDKITSEKERQDKEINK